VHVLLVEDDHLVAGGIVAGLRLHGLTVDHVASARLAQSALATSQFDICVLDLGLPDQDGIVLLTHWRAQGEEIPVILLTARDAVAHRIKGLLAGADDYMLKPFDLDELVARLHALLRRASGRTVDRIEHGGLSFTASSGEATLHGAPVDLTRRERALLRALLQRPQQILSADQLRDSVYGFETEVESNAVNVHVHHLRRKLGADVVETVRGIGYRLGKLAAGPGQ
jgi:DNA-binding response OmpR family regulator